MQVRGLMGEGLTPASAYVCEVGRDLAVGGGSIRSSIGSCEEAGALGRAMRWKVEEAGLVVARVWSSKDMGLHFLGAACNGAKVKNVYDADFGGLDMDLRVENGHMKEAFRTDLLGWWICDVPVPAVGQPFLWSSRD
ncbi:uncharacterized protein [Triticum aestivum]|uniref:uncharacterized protein isoform X2 n=1 Tax=Triticum aestivum TaxID=4565 RepID=UPI001D023140|nr:uncharacterized protein LOC123069656 isoform X2 [Triticum aestivum]